MRTLEISDKHDHVKCPSCGHKWWIVIDRESYWLRESVDCPKCDTPLKRPNLATYLDEATAELPTKREGK